MKTSELPAPVQLMNYIVGKWISKPIYVAAKLHIADYLSDGPKNISQLAKLSNAHSPSLYRMMRALASVGIFRELEKECFELTPMGELLKEGAMRSIAIMFNADWSDKAWGFFLQSIINGTTAFELAHGSPVTQFLENNHYAAKIFNEANALRAINTSRAIINSYDFSDISTLTDIGGGLGVLLLEILTAHPSLKGVVADLPYVIGHTKEIIKSRRLENRCQVIECDFFKNIPVGNDAYLMSNILHDWPDEQCQVILNNCHKAMLPESKLLIVEMIVPAGNQPSIAKLLDLEMLVITGGRERTENEFEALLHSCRFVVSRYILTAADVSIIECLRE